MLRFLTFPYNANEFNINNEINNIDFHIFFRLTIDSGTFLLAHKTISLVLQEVLCLKTT